jgi:hypothetical protein
MQKPVTFIVSLALMIGLTTVAAANYQKGEKKAKEKPSIYIIVQVNEEYQVIRKDELKDFNKTQMEQHKNAEKAYAEAKKEAKKSKQKFDQPKPVRPIIKTISGQFTSKEKADEQANKLREEAEKARAKSKGKE